MEKLDGLEKTFDTKMDAKLSEVLARLPPRAAASVPLQQQQQRHQRGLDFVGRARHVPSDQAPNSGAVAPAATTKVSVAEQNEDYDGDNDDEGEVAPNQHQRQQPQPQALGRPHGYNHNGRAAPPLRYEIMTISLNLS